MPVHDWTQVAPGIFHHFHQGWIFEISDCLNSGLLPKGYYSLAEQVAGDFGPDVLTLELGQGDGTAPPASDGPSGVATSPPRVRFTAQTEMDQYVLKQNSVVIRHSSGDKVIGFVEIVSAGNKASRRHLRTFVEKAAAMLYRGYHLMVIDLQPPGPRDPQGIHGCIWEEIADASYRQPADKPLTVASYDAGSPKTVYVEPVAVGDTLPDMPLFLQPHAYITVPLEKTYLSAFRHVPERWRSALEA